MRRYPLLVAIAVLTVAGCQPESSGNSGKKPTSGAELIVAPAQKLLEFKKSVVFKIQIPQAMKLYRATEGNYPPDMDKFLEYIGTQQIKLPEPPEGYEYQYHPEDGTLTVEPVKQP